ncbi:pyridoxal phosphate-dependent transferase [Blyttiomyces helicus]|uniref:Molybdenum cofactor sulfurase n=1 Tax=Blyttiomyces helicus TaxID=388810 RepID=A0A4P9WCM7_9FUNG|nr:pyridoxal phosphate-dependent transferase [Blyttiomyces helicus]|eukprot:RKO88650.1 pyridoxal phosphate-dependent transferase [Blyttiomyces helicus]
MPPAQLPPSPSPSPPPSQTPSPPLLALPRESEYPQLLTETYLDFAGTPPFPHSLLAAHLADLTKPTLYGNPHSAASPSASASAARIAAARDRILDALHAPAGEYAVVFTANATAAIRMVAEGLDWSGERRARLWYLRESHTSVVGMREEVGVRMVDETEVETYVAEGGEDVGDAEFNLFAYPAQCNFSGTRFPLEWSAGMRNRSRSWRVLLDAASYASTTAVDLSVARPDFLALSFYKMFGFPTGLGALVVRVDAAPLLLKSYFGGGTTAAIAPGSAWRLYRDDISARMEDGTLPFLEIAALKHGFDFIARIGGWPAVSAHATHIASEAWRRLAALRHGGDPSRPACILHSRHSPNPETLPTSHGPIIAFTLLTPAGTPVPPSDLARHAAVNRIHLRTGCFCNPGACAAHLGLSDDAIRENAELHGHVCWDDMDVVNGRAVGASRISFGAASTLEDVAAFIHFLDRFYVQPPRVPHPLTVSPHVPTLPSHPTLTRLAVHPIKSCGAHYPHTWPLTPAGLALDREWMLIDAVGVALDQKRVTRMCLIKPVELDWRRGRMVVEAPGMEKLVISVGEDEVEGVLGRVCGDRIPTLHITRPSVTSWFTTFLGTPCRLVRTIRNRTASCGIKRSAQQSPAPPLAFANESPLLFASESSLADLVARIEDIKERGKVRMEAFRANVVIGGDVAWAEDAWIGRRVRIGGMVFEIKGPCRRCHMVCIDQETGEASREPFNTLALHRRREGKIVFGSHAMFLDAQSAAPFMLTLGETLEPVE